MLNAPSSFLCFRGRRGTGREPVGGVRETKRSHPGNLPGVAPLLEVVEKEGLVAEVDHEAEMESSRGSGREMGSSASSFPSRSLMRGWAVMTEVAKATGPCSIWRRGGCQPSKE